MLYRGSIDSTDVDLLLMAIGHNASPAELKSYLYEMGLDGDGDVSFDMFYKWWTIRGSDTDCRIQHK